MQQTSNKIFRAWSNNKHEVFKNIAVTAEGVQEPVPGDVKTLAQRRKRLRCTYCDTQVKETNLDEIIPPRQGGRMNSHNQVLCCISCNASKGSRIDQKLTTWINKHEKMPKQRKAKYLKYVKQNRKWMCNNDPAYLNKLGRIADMIDRNSEAISMEILATLATPTKGHRPKTSHRAAAVPPTNLKYGKRRVKQRDAPARFSFLIEGRSDKERRRHSSAPGIYFAAQAREFR